jgi:hypothetical protein
MYSLLARPSLSHLELLQVDELAYVYQKIGFQCLLETRFEDAGFCLFQGELDPRIVISYFPDLRGTLLDADPTLGVFSGIGECMPPYDSIDDISTSPCSLPLPPLFPCTCTTAMTRLPFCRRLTCSRGQPSPQLLPLPRADHALRTANSRTSSCTWSRGVRHVGGVSTQVETRAKRL